MANGEAIDVKIGRHDERLKDLEEYRVHHQKEHGDIMRILDNVRNRPSWTVSITISGMASAIVYLITRLAG